MPLLSGGQVVITNPEEGPSAPTVAYQETVGQPAFTWIDPDGREWVLSNYAEDVGWFTLMGPSGWGAAPIEITTDSLPGGGERVRAIASKASTLQWPMEIFGRTHEEFVTRYRRISKAFKLTTVRQKPGILRVQRPNGTIREIEAYYSEGLGGEAEQNHLFARPVITLFCPDGKWRASAPIVATRTFTATTTSTGGGSGGGGGGGGGDTGGGTAVSYYQPYLSLTSSNVVGTPSPGTGDDSDSGNSDGDGSDSNSLTTITNPGDVEAWPVWTVTGPMTQLRAWNVTLGARFALTFNLGEQQTITITTERPSVRGPGDANLSKYIDWFNNAGTELWPLADGANSVGLEVDGAGSTTSVRLAFTPRYDNS